jgi:hypothetical protein
VKTLQVVIRDGTILLNGNKMDNEDVLRRVFEEAGVLVVEKEIDSFCG